MMQIIPAILATSEENYARDISRYKHSPSFKEGWVHIDFMDNKFVPNISIEPSIVAKYPIDLHKEAHLMVANPLEWVDKLIEAGFERIIFHIEAENVENCIEYIKEKKLQIGLAVNNDTPIENLKPFIEKINVVLVMAVIPGFQGQKFIPKSLERVKKIKSLGWKVQIGVDGAVKDDNIKNIVDAGVDFVNVGSYLLKGDLDENLENLWEKINKFVTS